MGIGRSRLETPEEAKRRSRGKPQGGRKVGRPHNDRELAEVQIKMIKKGLKRSKDTEKVECRNCEEVAEADKYEALDGSFEHIYMYCESCDSAFVDGEMI